MTASSQRSERALAESLTAIESLTGRLLAVLEREAAALEAGDHVGLEEISREKRTVAAQLEAAAGEQRALLASRGFQDDKEGLAKLFADLEKAGKDPSALRGAWERIRAGALRCQDLNGRNGIAIELYRDHFKRALERLSGQLHGEGTYGPDGRSRTAAPSLAETSA